MVKRSLLLTLALIAVGCAEPIARNLDELFRQGPQYLDPETMEPYSGPVFRTSFNDSTQVVLRVNLIDGRFHGDFEDFDPEVNNAFLVNESLGSYQIGTYQDGQLEGPFENFYPSGVLRGHGTYVAGVFHGPFETYYENGQLRFKGTYVDGELDGPSERYNEGGQLTGRSNHTVGELNGLSETYYANGVLMQRGEYYMGNRCGEWIVFAVDPRTYDPCPDTED